MAAASLSDQVTEFIFRYIDENQLKLGDSLPSEVKTCANLKISRGIVRETFRSLEATGIIEVGMGRRPRVGVLNNAFLIRLISHALSTQQVFPEQVLDLRMSVEVWATELAAQRCDDEIVERLRNSIRDMRNSLGDPDQFVDCDMRFHETINGSTGNPLVEVFGGAMRECMAKSMRAGLMGRTSDIELDEVIETHVVIADAIEAGRPAEASIAMKHHFSVARRALRAK